MYIQNWTALRSWRTYSSSSPNVWIDHWKKTYRQLQTKKYDARNQGNLCTSSGNNLLDTVVMSNYGKQSNNACLVTKMRAAVWKSCIRAQVLTMEFRKSSTTRNTAFKACRLNSDCINNSMQSENKTVSSEAYEGQNYSPCFCGHAMKPTRKP